MVAIREMTGTQLEDLVRQLLAEGCPADPHELTVWLEGDEYDLLDVTTALENVQREAV